MALDPRVQSAAADIFLKGPRGKVLPGLIAAAREHLAGQSFSPRLSPAVDA
jgi:hypothetical protein